MIPTYSKSPEQTYQEIYRRHRPTYGDVIQGFVERPYFPISQNFGDFVFVSDSDYYVSMLYRLLTT